ncbi:MAG: SDR family oxidoreductase [Candidatus Omnitrophota bacterium]|nr:SDR family oxidoreductase [Candidatus Omnitrophota bacterium]
MRKFQEILVTGGAGYVGARLVPKLLKRGYKVRVLDLYLFGEGFWPEWDGSAKLTEIKGDLRDTETVRRAVQRCDAVIHLACISNDPSFELNPDLGRSINYDAFRPLVTMSRDAGVKRFIYASSSSVYGISDRPNVTEDHPLKPLTDYSKYKALCEEILAEYESPDFTTVVLRPATVCGYSPRQRLDLTVNILTNHAVHNGKIKVFGGEQLRPNIHIEDLTDLYVQLLELPAEKVAGKTYNAGYENQKVKDIAMAVSSVVRAMIPERSDLAIETTPTDDNRSYHISSAKIKGELGFAPKRTIEDAVKDLVAAFQAGKIPNAMTDSRYFNIKTMQESVLAQPQS